MYKLVLFWKDGARTEYEYTTFEDASAHAMKVEERDWLNILRWEIREEIKNER